MKKLIYLCLFLAGCQPNLEVEPINQNMVQVKSVATYKANTITALQNAGIWDKLDMLQVRVDTNEYSALQDLIDTSRHAIKYGTVTFYVNGGMKGNGSNGRINTNYNPYTDGVNFTQDNNSYGVYIGNRVIENKADLSALTTGGNEIQCTSTTPSLYAYNNNTTQKTNANDIGRGFHAAKRTASNSWSSTVGGYIGSTFTEISQPIVNQPFWEYCRAVNTTYSKYTSRYHYYIFAGSGDIDLFLFNSIMEEYYLIPLGLAPTKRITFLGNSYIASRTLPQQVLAGINDYNNLDVNIQGFSGYTTPQVLTKAQTNVFPFQKGYLTKDVIFINEFTNDYGATGGNATTMYNNMVALCDSIRYWMPNAKIVVATMPPKTGAVNRQNDSDLNDTTYLNGMVRVKLVRDGHADYIADVASDTLMGRNGQNTNTTYYKTDGIHWNTVGTQRMVDYYIKPAIQLGL